VLFGRSFGAVLEEGQKVRPSALWKFVPRYNRDCFDQTLSNSRVELCVVARACDRLNHKNALDKAKVQ
jgi:hypothetical protein